MIYVGLGKPRLHLNPASNDMSHFFPSSWSTPDYFIMSADEYMAKREFDKFNMKGASTREIDLVAAAMEKEPLDFTPNMFDHPWTYRMSQLIKISGGTLWQFNAIGKDLEDYCRQVVILGGDNLKQWSWTDRNVRYPLYTFAAKILNRLRYRTVKKELVEWGKFTARAPK